MNQDNIRHTQQTILNLTAAATSAFSAVEPRFAMIPVFCSVMNEVLQFFDSKSTEKRLANLRRTVDEMKFSMTDFIDAIEQLDDHQTYVVRNNLKHLCIEALPETVDAFNHAFVQYIMGQGQKLDEEICEILRQCNANDIRCMLRVKSVLQDEQKMAQYKQDYENQKGRAAGGDYMIGKTIMWEDFTRLRDEDGKIMSMPQLLRRNLEEADQAELEEIFLCRSLLKLKNLGVIDIASTSFLGVYSGYVIDRFTPTVYGEKMMALVGEALD